MPEQASPTCWPSSGVLVLGGGLTFLLDRTGQLIYRGRGPGLCESGSSRDKMTTRIV
jgi:hypothetical protein